jgi:hypothetical protein
MILFLLLAQIGYPCPATSNNENIKAVTNLGSDKASDFGQASQSGLHELKSLMKRLSAWQCARGMKNNEEIRHPL